ncbi:hypothetical protein [uncultured Agrobacterium sp.]|uniref:hypothetical protein n=1 Tax=uncultured Agrobacterium sp. TaxID=157277 RepID=UPI0025F5182C|nr:hypothetical protein [uncultured Agrobacterium sp.]
MSHDDLKQRWAAANERVELLDQKRYKLLEPTQQEWLEAQTAFQNVVEECQKQDAILCEQCAAPIFPGDRYHAAVTPLCLQCAPAYQDLIDNPEMFVNSDDESPSNPEALKAWFDEHIAAGGKPDDKMVVVYE